MFFFLFCFPYLFLFCSSSSSCHLSCCVETCLCFLSSPLSSALTCVLDAATRILKPKSSSNLTQSPDRLPSTQLRLLGPFLVIELFYHNSSPVLLNQLNQDQDNLYVFNSGQPSLASNLVINAPMTHLWIIVANGFSLTPLKFVSHSVHVLIHLFIKLKLSKVNIRIHSCPNSISGCCLIFYRINQGLFLSSHISLLCVTCSFLSQFWSYFYLLNKIKPPSDLSRVLSSCFHINLLPHMKPIINLTGYTLDCDSHKFFFVKCLSIIPPSPVVFKISHVDSPPKLVRCLLIKKLMSKNQRKVCDSVPHTPAKDTTACLEGVLRWLKVRYRKVEVVVLTGWPVLHPNCCQKIPSLFFVFFSSIHYICKTWTSAPFYMDGRQVNIIIFSCSPKREERVTRSMSKKTNKQMDKKTRARRLVMVGWKDTTICKYDCRHIYEDGSITILFYFLTKGYSDRMMTEKQKTCMGCGMSCVARLLKKFGRDDIYIHTYIYIYMCVCVNENKKGSKKGIWKQVRLGNQQNGTTSQCYVIRRESQNDVGELL
ncbi:putative signal peptide protein [Puccinia sorghi]|uniref:Putative signal peptide protein n=1 Tax=Puccinia sorghi TaxID=27349 RepID=A0A0L6UZ86_9BASI|nr:putative signal peptide protein [Puccinia sorghi]